MKGPAIGRGQRLPIYFDVNARARLRSPDLHAWFSWFPDTPAFLDRHIGFAGTPAGRYVRGTGAVFVT